VSWNYVPDVRTSPVHLADDFWREKRLVGQTWGLHAIASVASRGTPLDTGASSMLGSLVGVLLFCTIQNANNQPGTLTSYTQPVVTGLFLIVVVAAQTCLTCNRAY
jgi:ribose/xylose/arabinose/galactoside ABC-type transport system permease subunit